METPLWLPQVLSDRTVRLDAYTLADAEAHAAGEDREMRLRFDAPDPDAPASLEHVKRVVRTWRAARAAGRPNIVYAIRVEGGLAGGCEVRRLDATGLNISYWIYPAFRGRGLARRAVALLCGAADGLGADRIEAHVDTDNLPSQRTAVNAGFAEAGEVEDEAWDGRRCTRIRYVRPLRV